MPYKALNIITFFLISLLTTQANTLAVLNNHSDTTYMFVPDENTVQYTLIDNAEYNFQIREIHLNENPTSEELIFEVNTDKFHIDEEDTSWQELSPEFITLSKNEFVASITLSGVNNNIDNYKTIFFHEKDGEIMFFEILEEPNFSNQKGNGIFKIDKFKDIMHPIKLSLLKYLNINNFDTRANILKNLQIASGNFDYHFRVMEKKGLMVAIKEFINGNSRIIIHIEPSGVIIYNKFNKAIVNFLNC